MVAFEYDKSKLLSSVKYASRIPTRAQMRLAHDEGWADQIKSVQDEIAVAEGCRFDIEKPQAVAKFFAERLTHGEDPFYNQPFKLLEWQRERIVNPIYGWWTADGFRRYRSFFVFVPKKQGKTQLAAGLALIEFHFVRGSRVYIVGVAETQALEMYDQCAGMVERSDVMRRYIKVTRSTGKLKWQKRNCRLSCLTKSAAASEGKNASCLILEEFHAWRDRKLFDSLLYAGATKLNPMLGMITTAGDDVTSLCHTEYERAKRIIEGDDPTTDHLAVVYEAPKDAAYDDLDAWKKANPSYGKTMPERGVLADIRAAKGNPQRIASLKRYRLNIWTQSGVQWLDADQWSTCDVLESDDNVEGLLYAGLDLARTRDFAALVLLWYRDDGSFDVLPKIYYPAALVKEKEETDKIPLGSWIDAGWVVPTEGNEIDQEIIFHDVVSANKRWGILDLGFDSYNAGRISKDLISAGINCTAVPQTMTYLGKPSGEFERALSDKRIRHDANPCLKWMISNAKAITDSNNNVRPCKQRSTTRIDGLTATIIALQRALAPDAQRPISDKPWSWSN
ncbi:MAG TPA: hypothetical protein DDW52_11795 [Planctomycetaceae bacterium]|nr:hypothetical protein [Planctomycetaceae bacterium]